MRSPIITEEQKLHDFSDYQTVPMQPNAPEAKAVSKELVHVPGGAPEVIDTSHDKPLPEVTILARLALTKSRLVVPVCDRIREDLITKYADLLDRNDGTSGIEKLRILDALDFGRIVCHLVGDESRNGSYSPKADEVMQMALNNFLLPEEYQNREKIDQTAQDLYVKTSDNDPVSMRASQDALGFVRALHRSKKNK